MSAFKEGFSPKATQTKLVAADSGRRDEYQGGYRCASEGMSPDELWALAQNPVRETPLAAKGLRSVGG